MGASQFDRKSYMPGEVPRPTAHVQDRLTYVLAVVAILGAGYAAYKIIGSSSTPVPSPESAQLKWEATRLDALEHRLDAIEEQLKRSRSVPAPTAVKQEPATPEPAPTAAPAPFRVRISPAAAKPQLQPSAPPQPSPELEAQRQERERAISSLQGDVAATRQEWAATADRLGNVVGELNSQHQEIVRNKESLAELEERFERDSVPFTLRKDGVKQQVGPVRLLLEGTDVKNSRYTMRLFFQDKWIELKDRALHEAIQFYEPGGEVALELMVSHIAKEAVSGRIALPPPTSASR